MVIDGHTEVWLKISWNKSKSCKQLVMVFTYWSSFWVLVEIIIKHEERASYIWNLIQTWVKADFKQALLSMK